MKMNPDDLVLFSVIRESDHTGVSGEGVVAYGIRFPHPLKKVVLGWVTDPHNSVTVFDSMDAVKAIHGHGGDTRYVQVYRMDTGTP